MHWLLSIAEFILAVLSQWATLLTGGVLIAMIAIWERLPGDISWVKYAIILILTFFTACYLTWLKERKSAEEAKYKIYILQTRSNAKKKLAEFHDQIDVTLWRLVELKDQKSVHRIQTVVCDALGELYKFRLLIIDDLLERFLLPRRVRNARVVMIENQSPIFNLISGISLSQDVGKATGRATLSVRPKRS